MKTADDVRPRVSKTTTVRLDDLQPQVLAAAAAAGVGPSTWLRDLVRREFAGAQQPASEGVDGADGIAEGAGVYRAWLDADLTAQLDERRRRDGFRSRAAVLRALIKGVGITAGGVPSAALGPADGASVAPGGASVSLGHAVAVLGVSNHELVAIGRNVSQIAKAMRVGERSERVIDRIRIEEAVATINRHVESASQVLGVLRPLLKRSKT
jgi:hypothetical protein